MRFLIVFTCVVLLSGAQANFLQDIGNDLKAMAIKAGQSFKTTGLSLLQTLDQTAEAVLRAGVEKAKSFVTQIITSLITKAAGLLGGQKRELSDLIGKFHQVETGITSLIENGKTQLQGMLGTLKTAFGDIIHKVSTFDITPEAVIQKIEQLVGSHNLMADGLLQTLLSEAQRVFTSIFHHSKRNAFTDFFANLGHSIASTFTNMIAGVKTLATSAGTAIKNTAAGLLQSTKDSISQLGDKLVPHLQNLQGHVTTILLHGMNALNAMKDAAGDILKQTMANVQNPVKGIINTVGQAGGTVVQHVAGAILGTPKPTTTMAPST